MKTIVVIPAYQVARTIGSLVLQLTPMGYDVIVVDDGSRDRTGDVARTAGAHVLRHARNIGKGRSLRDGFAEALARGAETVIAMDGDGQHLPADLPRLIAAIQDGRAGIAIGNRMRVLRSMPWLRRITNWTMSLAISWWCRQRVPDSQCGLRAIRRDVLERVPLTTDRYEIESELLIKAARAGVRIVSVPIATVYRDERSRIRPIADTVRFFRFLRTLHAK